MLYLGCYVNFTAPDYYLDSVQKAFEYGANCFMFYLGSPRSLNRSSMINFKINAGRDLLKKYCFDENKIIIHAPYVINIANSFNKDLHQLTVNFLRAELQRTQVFKVPIIVLHPGCAVGASEEVAIKTIITTLNEVLDNDQTQVKIALETMSGKGSELCYRFEQLKTIIENVNNPERVGVCFDTCHVHDAGYRLQDFDNVIQEFDRIVGIEKILVCHINDSLNERGSRKDRHANIGYGKIGLKTLRYIVQHPKLQTVPKILETPLLNGQYQFRNEINLLQKKNN